MGEEIGLRVEMINVLLGQAWHPFQMGGWGTGVTPPIPSYIGVLYEGDTTMNVYGWVSVKGENVRLI